MAVLRRQRHARCEHGVAGDGDFAAVGLLQAGNASQQRGLAAAARTQKHQELALGYVERNAIERRGVAAPVSLANIADADQRGHSRTLPETPFAAATTASLMVCISVGE